MTDHEKLLEDIRSVIRSELAGVRAEKRFLNVDEAAELTRFSRSTLYNLVNQRKVPFIKQGGKLLFVRGDLEAWLTERRTNPVGDDRRQVGTKRIKIKS